MIIENPELIFRNFRGEAKSHNPVGMKNFCVQLDEDQEAQARKLGYKVLELDSIKFIQVNLPSGLGFVDEDIPELLDRGHLFVHKIALAGMQWQVGDRSGVKVFLVEIKVGD